MFMGKTKQKKKKNCQKSFFFLIFIIGKVKGLPQHPDLPSNTEGYFGNVMR